MKLGFSEFVLLFIIVLILFGPTVIPWVQRWLRRANKAKVQVQRQHAQMQAQMVQETNALLHRFQIVAGGLLFCIFVGYAGYLLLHPVAYPPQKYTPVAGTMTLTTAGNTTAHTVSIAPYYNPICVAWQDNWLYAAVEGNKVIRMREDGSGLTEVFSTEGEISSMVFGADNCMYLAREGGIYKASFDGWAVDVKPILTSIQDRPLHFPAGIAVDAQGNIYFTEYAQMNTAFEQGFYTELLAHTSTGTAYVYTPKTGNVEPIVTGLRGASGIALSSDETTLYISEANARRVWAVPASARNATLTEQGEILLEGLDGYAAGLTPAVNGDVWVAVCGTPAQWVDKTANFPLLRKAAMNLPHLTQNWLLNPTSKSGWAFSISKNGTLSRAVAVQVPKNAGRITGVCETERAIWLANADGSNLYVIAR